MRSKHIRLLSLALLGISGVVIFPTENVIRPTVQAQSCTNPPTMGQNTTWPKGAQVTVNIDPNSFSSAESQAIQTAFTNWQNANGASGNNSGVTFTFTSNSTPASGTNTYQVSATTQTGGQASTGGTTNGTNRLSASTTIDPRVTDPTALTDVMAHEIGHTFGLDDCTSCAAGTSVMTLPPCCN